jgi:hypothetical protein
MGTDQDDERGFFLAEQAAAPLRKTTPVQEKPHHLGHR